ncbi:MAG: hypothetical protein VZQ98_07005, partial [Bacteroidales bacterium]|nr:hypothetical protein [Bacteroidales bacterium]
MIRRLKWIAFLLLPVICYAAIPIYTNYNLYWDEYTHGRIVAPEKGNAGDSIYFNVFANYGWKVREVSVDMVRGGNYNYKTDADTWQINDTLYGFYMTNAGSYANIYASFEPTIFHKMVLDSTFDVGNFKIEPYWNVSYWKGLDSVGIGTKMCILPNYYSSDCDRPSSYPQRRILFKSIEGEMIEWTPLPVCYDSIFFYMPDRDVKVSIEEINYHSIIIDSSFARCNVVVNPNRDLDSIADGLLLNFMSIFNGLGNESKLTIQTKDGDTLKSFKIG